MLGFLCLSSDFCIVREYALLFGYGWTKWQWVRKPDWDHSWSEHVFCQLVLRGSLTHRQLVWDLGFFGPFGYLSGCGMVWVVYERLFLWLLDGVPSLFVFVCYL